MDLQLDHTKYAAYLNQHLLAADAGVKAFKAAAQTWEGTPWAATLEQLYKEETESHAKTRALIQRLGYGPGTTRTILHRLAATAGRFNPINITRNREGRMTQVELESLISATRAQQSMWETLTVLATIDNRLDGPDCEKMVRRCQNQRARVVSVSTETVVERFTEHGKG